MNKRGQPTFNLLARNGRQIGTSEIYQSEGARENGIASVMKNAYGAPVVDLT